MVRLLAKMFIKDYKNYKDTNVRERYGILSGCVGILLNAMLFGIKFFAGLLSHSIAITADAFNNLSDAGSSVITLLGLNYRLRIRIPNILLDMADSNICQAYWYQPLL